MKRKKKSFKKIACTTTPEFCRDYFIVTPDSDNSNSSKIFLTINYGAVYGVLNKADAFNTTNEKKADEKVQDEIKRGLDEAVKNESTIATFEFTKLTDQTVNTADWAYSTNTWKGHQVCQGSGC